MHEDVVPETDYSNILAVKQDAHARVGINKHVVHIMLSVGTNYACGKRSPGGSYLEIVDEAVQL